MPLPGGKVEGSAYLVPKPEDHGYTLMKGVVTCATAMSAPSGLKATPSPLPVGKVEGSEYLVPKPVPEVKG